MMSVDELADGFTNLSLQDAKKVIEIESVLGTLVEYVGDRLGTALEKTKGWSSEQYQKLTSGFRINALAGDYSVAFYSNGQSILPKLEHHGSRQPRNQVSQEGADFLFDLYSLVEREVNSKNRSYSK